MNFRTGQDGAEKASQECSKISLPWPSQRLIFPPFSPYTTFPRKQGKIIEWFAIISLGYKEPLEEVATKIQDFFEQIPLDKLFHFQ